MHKLAHFLKYNFDDNQANIEELYGSVLLLLNNINFQKQFHIKKVFGDNQVSRVEFHGKHL